DFFALQVAAQAGASERLCRQAGGGVTRGKLLVVEVAEFQQAGDDALDNLCFGPLLFKQPLAQLGGAARAGGEQSQVGKAKRETGSRKERKTRDGVPGAKSGNLG